MNSTFSFFCGTIFKVTLKFSYKCLSLLKHSFLFQQAGYFTCKSFTFLRYFEGLHVTLLQFDGDKVRVRQLGLASCQTQECSTLGIYLELKAVFSNV